MLGRALLPLRAFLGFTFCFAGLQKLANPQFLQASNPASIQSQLAGAVRVSPIHALISPLTHVATPLGVLIAVAELSVGLGTVLGLWQRLAAAGGIALSLMLFLTVSFHSSPYYTGSDIVFVFAWTPLLLAGAGPLLAADAMIAARSRAPRATGRTGARADARQADRREAMLKGTVTAIAAVAGLVLAGATAGLGRLAGGTKNSGSGTTTLPPAGSGGSGGGQPAGTAIGPASGVPVGDGVLFTDPSTNGPGIVIQPTRGKFVAYSATCPHAGCTVGYNKSDALIECPCHGSHFNPANGAVVAGPAPIGLTPVTIAEGSDGQLYASLREVRLYGRRVPA